MDIAINYPAVLVCALVAMVLGSLWYGPLFGKAWMRMIGVAKPEVLTPEIKASMMRSYAIVLVSSLVMAYVLAQIVALIAAATAYTGAMLGFMAGAWCWLGFCVPALLGPTLWEGRPWKYWFLTAGYYLATLLIMGLILAVWR